MSAKLVQDQWSQDQHLSIEQRRRSPNTATASLASQQNGSPNKVKNTITKLIDGWQEGRDPKVDHSGHVEFGGAWGVGAMMVFFPLLMYYMWIGATFYDGKVPKPTADQSWLAFIKHLWNLTYTHAYPGIRVWKIYWIFFFFEAANYCIMPGVWGYGKPLAHLDGKQLKYYCSGVWSLYFTMVVGAFLHVTGLFRLDIILDEFGPLMTVAILSGFIVAGLAYISALARGAQHRMSGNHVYDFFMGAELNPRIGILDFKMFFMMHLPWYVIFGLSCATATRQYEEYGYVSAEVWFLVMGHFLYTNACAKGEECSITTWDIYYEKWGFMIIFWNLAGVPLSYCHATIYVANHLDIITTWSIPPLRTPCLILLFTSYIFMYWIWDTMNSQKNRFRAQERGTFVARKTFPQLPWGTLTNPRVIKTASGDSLLVEGWYGYARKLHYTCDAYFALAWGAVTGFGSPFPWFYPVFFICMVTHRAYRDVQRCKVKYGESWIEYEKAVPWIFIPYIF